MPNEIIKGTFTTIRWGTGDTVLPTAIGTAIVNSVRVQRLGGEPIKIEDREGFTAVIVGLDDGDRLEIECIDNTALTWPDFMDVVSMQGPEDGSAVNFLVVDKSLDQAKKREGMRSLIVEKYAGVTLS